MKKRVFLSAAVLAAFFLVFGFSALSAQSAPDAVQAYHDQMQLYKNHLKELRELKQEYQTASAERKDEIQSQFTPLLQETSLLQKTLVPLAISAFQAQDGQDEELSVFLMSMLDKDVVVTEDYETAYEIAKALDGSIPEQYSYLYAYGAYAAFNVMALDDAESFFRKAAENGGLEGLRKQDPRGELQIPAMITQVLPQYRKLWADEQAAREKDAAEELPRVLLRTSKGDIVLELFLREAPEAVGNFMTLVSQKYYDGVPFHRVLAHFMAQGGDPTGTGAGGPGYCIKDECKKPGARMQFRGSLSMAKTAAPDTGGSQFFLCFIPTSHLNGQHTVFGRVVEGLDVLSELQRINPEGRNLPAPDRIVEARILRGEPTPFTKLPEK